MHHCGIVFVTAFVLQKDSLHSHYNLRSPAEGPETPAFKGRRQARFQGDNCL